MDRPALRHSLKPEDGWVVLRTHHSRRELTILFAGESPTVAELAAIRRISPELGSLPLADLKQRIGESSEVPLGELGGIEAHALISAARREGLAVREVSRDRTDLIPYNVVTQVVQVIEDHEENRRTCLALIEAGCPVQERESD